MRSYFLPWKELVGWALLLSPMKGAAALEPSKFMRRVRSPSRMAVPVFQTEGIAEAAGAPLRCTFLELNRSGGDNFVRRRGKRACAEE